MATHKGLFTGMRRGRILRQGPVGWNLGISGIVGNGEWRNGALLSAGRIGLGRTLLPGWWWRDLMLGRNRSHHRSLSWMGRVRTSRNWAVVRWSGSGKVGARRRDGIGTRSSVHRRRLRGVMRRSHVHRMDGRLERGRTWVIVLWWVGRGVHGIVMRIGSGNGHMSVPCCTCRMGEHTG